MGGLDCSIPVGRPEEDLVAIAAAVGEVDCSCIVVGWGWGFGSSNLGPTFLGDVVVIDWELGCWKG